MLSDVYLKGAEATLDTHNTLCQDASTYSGVLEDTHGEAESGGEVDLGDGESLDFCGASGDSEAEDLKHLLNDLRCFCSIGN